MNTLLGNKIKKICVFVGFEPNPNYLRVCFECRFWFYYKECVGICESEVVIKETMNHLLPTTYTFILIPQVDQGITQLGSLNGSET